MARTTADRLVELRSEAQYLSTKSTITEAEDARLTSCLDEIEELAKQPFSFRSVPSGPGIHRSDGFPSGLGIGRRRSSGTSEVRAAALDLVERSAPDGVADSTVANIVRAVEADRTDGVANYVKAAADPSYLDAFAKLCSDPVRGHLEFDADEARAYKAAQYAQRSAMVVSTGASGGVAIPTWIDPSFVITNDGVNGNPMRRLASYRQIAGPRWSGVASAGVTASWDGELVEVSDDSPGDLTAPTITLHKGMAFVQASFELFEDYGGRGLAAELGQLFADARLRLEANAFTVGGGVTAPMGFLTELTATTNQQVVTTTNDVLGLVDIYALQDSLGARHQPGASFMASLSYLNRVRRMGEGTTGSNSAFWTDLGGGVPAQLLGRPINENSVMSATLTTAEHAIVYADFSRFRIVDHLAAGQVEFIPQMMSGANHLPNGARGLLLHWRTGSGWLDVNAGRVLDIA